MGKVISISDSSILLDSGVILAIDTNALLWTFYSRVTSVKTYQKNYSEFIVKAIANKNKIVITAFNLNEMFHVIEKNEWEIYKSKIGSIKLKDFRRILDEREKVKAEISLIFSQIKSISNVEILGSVANSQNLDDFLDTYTLHRSDFFDYCLMESSNGSKWGIVTDDKDFDNTYNVADIYTANPNMLSIV